MKRSPPLLSLKAKRPPANSEPIARANQQLHVAPEPRAFTYRKSCTVVLVRDSWFLLLSR